MSDTATLAALAACLTLAACSNKPLLRDWYVGRELLEPQRYVETVKRDAWGEPILPESTR